MNTNIIKSPLSKKIVSAIQTVVGPNPVGLHEPSFAGNEWKYVKECLDSTFVSSVGKFVDQFENELIKYTGAKYAIAVVNGTAALHISLKLAGVVQGDEVLIPALTFVATANAVEYCGASPHFVDSDMTTLGLDPHAIRNYLQSITDIRNKQCINRKTGQVIRAIVPMHTFGHPVDMEAIISLAKDYHLAIVEDAAESLGSYINGQHTGTFGQLGVLSFNGNKTITTGGGGAIITNDEQLAKRAKHLTTTAKLPHRWEYLHDDVGYNYRMPNINAALGCAQLEQLPGFLHVKRSLFDRYKMAFTGMENVNLVEEPHGCQSNYWLQTLILNESVASERDNILADTNDAGIMTRPVWKLLNQLPPYQHCQQMELSVAKSLERRLINIPSGVQFSRAES
ncbi:MAG: perosamine synthetase [Paraglaciecola sp.]